MVMTTTKPSQPAPLQKHIVQSIVLAAVLIILSFTSGSYPKPDDTGSCKQWMLLPLPILCCY